MMLHPEFDGMWFVEVEGETFEAKTLRDLQTQLPKFEFECYFPNGFNGVVRLEPPREYKVKLPWKKDELPPTPPPTEEEVKKEAAEASSKKERVLGLWEKGYASNEIAKKAKIKKRYVHDLVSSARSEGDRRAVIRRGNSGPLTEEQKDHIAELIAKGYSSGDVAFRYGVTRNSIIGMMHRRKVKDEKRRRIAGIDANSSS